MTARLFVLHPRLYALLDASPAALQREVVIEACAAAIQCVEATPLQRAAYALLQGSGLAGDLVVEALRSEAESADARYQEEARQAPQSAEAVRWFRLARLSDALAWGLTVPEGHWHDAVYDACHVTPNPKDWAQRLYQQV